MSGDVGLAISSILILNLNFQWGMRQSAELENIMTSVERIFEYGAIKPEAALEAGIFCILYTATATVPILMAYGMYSIFR